MITMCTTTTTRLGLGEKLTYGWAICGLALTQYVTPMTAKPMQVDEKPMPRPRVKKVFIDD